MLKVHIMIQRLFVEAFVIHSRTTGHNSFHFIPRCTRLQVASDAFQKLVVSMLLNNRMRKKRENSAALSEMPYLCGNLQYSFERYIFPFCSIFFGSIQTCTIFVNFLFVSRWSKLLHDTFCASLKSKLQHLKQWLIDCVNQYQFP